jgi:hypothetical protein
MSIDEEEIRAYLENKKLKDITLPENSNDIDQGSSTAKEEKIGTKSSLARAEYLVQRNEKIKYGDRQAIAEYVTEQNEIRQRLEEQKYRQRLDYEFEQQEKARLAIQAKITPEDIENEKEDIEALVRKRDKEIANVFDYFNCPEKEWQEWLSDHHSASESPANSLIGNGTVGFVCKLHRYKDGACSAYTIGPIENHFRTHDPQMHRQAIIDTINEKYDKLIEARKDKTLEDKEVAFKREVRDIEKIPTRPGGDEGLRRYSGTKITKGDKARIRREEEAENERNRKIYRGLY